MPAEPPASLWDAEGRVLLSPAGVRLCAAALEIATRQKARHGGGAVPPAGDLAYLRRVFHLAEERAAGTAPGTMGRPFRAELPSSDALVSTAGAAAIWQCSPRAIRRAIEVGRLPGRQHGRDWLIPESAVREAAGRRRRGGR
jgi:hypothetical protein